MATVVMTVSLHVSAQLTAEAPSLATTGTPGASTGGGPLENAPNPVNTPTVNTNTAGGANLFSRIFRNPMMAYGFMGGDNLQRALMMPVMSRLGASNTANYYYMNGGMDKFFKVMMTDWANKMLAQSMGMNPSVSAFLTGQIFDAPDQYALTNYLFSNMMRNQNRMTSQGMATQSQGNGALPNGAASSSSSPNNVFRSFMNPMALAPLAWMM